MDKYKLDCDIYDFSGDVINMVCRFQERGTKTNPVRSICATLSPKTADRLQEHPSMGKVFEYHILHGCLPHHMFIFQGVQFLVVEGHSDESITFYCNGRKEVLNLSREDEKKAKVRDALKVLLDYFKE